jgi:hypothetical protein
MDVNLAGLLFDLVLTLERSRRKWKRLLSRMVSGRNRPVDPAEFPSVRSPKAWHDFVLRAFSSEVGTGSREENASKQKLGLGSDSIRTGP